MCEAGRMAGIRRTNLTRRHPRSEPRSGRFARRLECAVGAVTGVIVALVTTSPHAQTLTQALAEAYNNNPQLLAQRALLRATDEQVPQALSFWRPQVTFKGQVGMATSSIETQPGPEALVTRSV